MTYAEPFFTVLYFYCLLKDESENSGSSLYVNETVLFFIMVSSVVASDFLDPIFLYML